MLRVIKNHGIFLLTGGCVLQLHHQACRHMEANEIGKARCSHFLRNDPNTAELRRAVRQEIKLSTTEQRGLSARGCATPWPRNVFAGPRQRAADRCAPTASLCILHLTDMKG